MPGASILPSMVVEYFAFNRDSAILRCYFKFVSGQTAAALTEFDSDPNRPIFSSTDQLAEPAALCHRHGDVLGQCVLEKAEYIE